MIRKFLLWLIDKIKGLLDPEYAAEQKAYKESRAQNEVEQSKEAQTRAGLQNSQAETEAESRVNQSEIDTTLARIEEIDHAKEKDIDALRGKPDADILRGDL